MRIPSTQALRALDSFARHGSVWQAADELHLTRSAVSHQLRLLERDLGFALLKRFGKGVALTPQGKRYAADVRRALTLIGDAAVHYGDRGLRGSLRISCTPGFASLWLCTQIAAFKELYPEIALHILTPPRLDDVSDPDVDAFIAFGTGDWSQASVELLSQVEFGPMCSPVLLNRIGGLVEPLDVFRAPVLHLGGHADWGRWFEAAGVVPPPHEPGIVFSDMNLVVAAATAAQGIAMGDALTCRQALDSGQLVRPYDLTVLAEEAYYLVMDQHHAGNPALLAFQDWLKSRLVHTASVLRPA